MKAERFEPLIYHIAFSEDWYLALDNGEYTADSLMSEGFIHCSTREQVLRTAEAFFKGRKDLVLLEIAADRLPVEVRYEPAANGEFFPHIYGSVALPAVERVLPLRTDAEERFVCEF